MAANNGRRGATVLTTYDITAREYIVTKDEIIDALKYQILIERKFISKQRAAQDRMRTQNSGVRSSNISADLAAFDMAVQKAEDRIKALRIYYHNSIIEYLDVNKSIKNTLFQYSWIRTLNEIDGMSDEEMMKHKGIKEKSVRKIRLAADKLRKEILGEVQ